MVENERCIIIIKAKKQNPVEEIKDKELQTNRKKLP